MMKILLPALLLCFSTSLLATNEDSLYVIQHYNKAEYRIPMRDGVSLFTVVYSPMDTSITYPILFNRTPYDVAPYGTDRAIIFRRGLFPAFLREGFIFVYQDVRGRFMSEGTYAHMRPFIEKKKNNTDIDENSDVWDSMDWLVKNIRGNNGRIGMWGISYPGFYTSFASVKAHPAFKCASPQAPISDWYFDDVHHHGAFFLAANMDFFGAMDQPRHGFSTEWFEPYSYGTNDGFDFFMRMEPLSRIRKEYFGDSIVFWNDIVSHPDYDQFWQERNLLPHLKNITPAILVVGGWYDAEDLYGTFKTYQAIEKNNPGARNNLVIGPWIHGGWARTDGSSLGNVSFRIKASEYYRDSIELPFFCYYLKDKGKLSLPEATMFITGKNEWRKFSTWPPKGLEKEVFYLHEGNALSVNLPSGMQSYDEFLSDPWKPVPYTEDIYFGMTKEYMTDDQRFTYRRPDVLTYETDVLSQDLTLAGPLMAHLKVSTTGTDADWVIKVIDVYPDSAKDNPTTRRGMHMAGYQQMIRSEVIRGRYRKSYSQPEPFTPGKIESVDLELQDVLHCFKKGHRLMVQVQSTWFPLVDLNPQKYVPNIFEAKEEDFIKATHRVYHQKGNASSIEVGVLKGNQKSPDQGL